MVVAVAVVVADQRHVSAVVYRCGVEPSLSDSWRLNLGARQRGPS